MKNYLLVLMPLLAVEWLVGMLRFSFKAFETVFKVINFPLGYVYLWLETKSSSWWFELLGTQLINDEIAQLITFLLMAAIQAFLLYLLFRLVGLIKKS